MNPPRPLAEPKAAPDNSPLSDYIHFALHRCSEAADAYANAARVVPRGLRSLFLSTLAIAKREQALSLRQLLREECYLLQPMRADATGRNNPTPSVVSYLLDVGLKPVSSLLDIFSFVMKRERKTFDLYAKLAQLEEDPDTKALLDYLVTLQQAQLTYAETLYTQLMEAGPGGEQAAARTQSAETEETVVQPVGTAQRPRPFAKIGEPVH